MYGRIKRFIAVSTDEVYGESSVGRDSGCTEASTLEPTNPYSAAKAGAGAGPLQACLTCTLVTQTASCQVAVPSAAMTRRGGDKPSRQALLPACAEMMVKAYMTSYKLPCIITRGNNVYGPHQFPEKLVPKFTLLAKRGEALPVHGAGQVCHHFTVFQLFMTAGPLLKQQMLVA